MLSDTLYGNLTAISMPNLRPYAHVADEAGDIAWRKLTPRSSSLILRCHQRAKGCTDVELSTRTVMVVTSFCSVRRRARPWATRQPSLLDNAWHACITWAPSGSIALENVGPQHMRGQLYCDRSAAVALARA